MNKTDLYSIYSIIDKLKSKSPVIEESLNPKLFNQVKGYISSFVKTDIVYYAAAMLIHEESKHHSIYEISDKKMKSRLNNMMKFLPKTKIVQRIESLREDAPANATGSSVAGLDNNPPGKQPKKKKYLRKFAGRELFMVDPNRYVRAQLGKKRYEQFETYVGDDECGQEIKEYGTKYPFKPIILMNEKDGTMMFIRYGKNDKGGLI